MTHEDTLTCPGGKGPFILDSCSPPGGWETIRS